MAENEDSLVPGLGPIVHFGAHARENMLVPALGAIATFRPNALLGLAALDSQDGISRNDLIRTRSFVIDEHETLSKVADRYFTTQQNYHELEPAREQLKGRVQEFQDAVGKAIPHIRAAVSSATGRELKRRKSALNKLVEVERSSAAVISNLARPLSEAITIEQARRFAAAVHAPSSHQPHPSQLKRGYEDLTAGEGTDAPTASSSSRKRARVDSQREHRQQIDPTPPSATWRQPAALSEGFQNTLGIPQSAWNPPPPLDHDPSTAATYPRYEHATAPPNQMRLGESGRFHSNDPPSLFPPEAGPSRLNQPLNVASSSAEDVNSPKLFTMQPPGGLPQQPLLSSQPAAAGSVYVSELMSWNLAPPQPSSSTQTMGTQAHASSSVTPQVSGPRPQSRGKPRQTPGPNISGRRTPQQDR